MPATRNSLFTKLFRRPAKTYRHPTRLGLTTLEGREMPAVSAVLSGGILTVTGTNGPDTIPVVQSGTTITAAGKSFATANVNSIVVNGLDGNDVISVSSTKPATIDGGAGNDTLTASSGNDRLVGGSGVNSYPGTAASDIIVDPVLTGGRAMSKAIMDKYQALGGSGGPLGMPTADETAAPQGGRVVVFQNGYRIYWSAATGAWEVHGAIRVKYDATAGLTDAYGKKVQDVLGLPTSDELPYGTNGRVNHFQGGDIYANLGIGVYVVYGAIKDKLHDSAGLKDAYGRPVQDLLGLPTSDELPTANNNNGRVSHFQGGDIYANLGVGAYVVYGAIKDKYNAMGGPGGKAGLPTADEMAVPGGRVGRFSGADLYAILNLGVFEVNGSIRVEYNKPGVAGTIGLPITDETTIPGGWYNNFQKGSIYANGAAADHQAHEVHGPIRDKWLSLGGAQGLLGFPTNDQFTTTDGSQVSLFENGTISYRADVGIHLGFNRNQVIGALKKSEVDGVMDIVEFNYFRAIANDLQIFVDAPTRNLLHKVIDGDPANAHFQGLNIGNLNLVNNFSALIVDKLERKWFEGQDHPEKTFLGVGTVTPTNPGGIRFVNGGVYQRATGPLFGAGGPVYSDIFQGNLGDCIYLAPLAEVAARSPNTIRDMFTSNGDGTYSVRFFHNGAAEYLTVDDQLPNGGTVFDRPNAPGGPIWAALAEKALAQLNESGWLVTKSPGLLSYAALDFGNSDNVESTLKALTGQTASTNGTDIGNAWSAGRLIVLGTGTPSSDQVVANHEYAVIGAQIGSSPATTYFRLFNPWGEKGGTGSDGKFKPGELWISQAGITQNFAYSTWAGATPEVGMTLPKLAGPSLLPPTEQRADDRQQLAVTIEPNQAASSLRPTDPIVPTAEVAHARSAGEPFLSPTDPRADDHDLLKAAIEKWSVALDT